MSEINRRVAEEILEVCWHEDDISREDFCTCGRDVMNVGSCLNPDYLTDWNAMRLVIEKMREDGFACVISWDIGEPCGAIFMNKARGVVQREAKTLPEAICLAALAAVGGNHDK